MLFPELRDRVKGFLADFGKGPVSLDLKSYDGVEFNPVDVAWYAQNGYQRMFALLGGGMPAWSGESVSVTSALNHSAVWACNRIVSESMGFLPAVLMQQKDGQKRPATELPMFSAMKNAPNEEITAQSFRETLTSHAVLGGNAYAKIERRSGTGVALQFYPLCPEMVRPDREKTGQKRLVYVISQDNGPDKTYTVENGKPHEILHIRGLGWDGIRGYSVITMGRQSMGTAIAAERNVARFWAMGGRVPYHLEMPKRFKNEEDFQNFRKDWEEVHREPSRAPILQDEMKYVQDGLSMADAQALETRQFTISEICRWFSVSPHLVGDLSRATFSNVEHLSLEFVKMTLSQWITRWEQEFWRCVLTPDEKAAGYFLKHNVNALLRGDFKTRMEGYASALQNGHLNVDEVRDLEDRNPLPDDAGEDYHIQLNMQTLPSADPTPQPQGQQQSSLVTLRGRNAK